MAAAKTYSTRHSCAGRNLKLKRMESLFILIPIAMLFVAIAVKLFFWAVDNKQFDDLDNAAQSILFDDDPPHKPPAAGDSEKPKPDA